MTQMTLIEYANTHCSHLLKSQSAKSLLEMIEQQDDLPFDEVRPDDDGMPTKVVMIDNERWISIYDLLSYTREDIVQKNDPDLLMVFDNYMEQVDVQDLDILNILQLIQKYKDIKKQEEADANALLSPKW